MHYCMYLRKSRADMEAETHGEGETLLRHEKMLLDLALKLNLTITKIYREIVSGETISARPVMQQLLVEVEQGIWNGVFVMEIERLARGDTIDQGIVAQAFKYTNTKIITPVKTYDPANEFDEEYFEFGLFMSRREFKTINRRIQRGRIASVKEGKYISSIAPYGYDRIKIKKDKGYTLKINDEQAKVIKMIYSWYTVGELQPDGSYEKLGAKKIATKLDSMNIKPMFKSSWSRSSITDILKNPVYIGKIRWQYRKEVKQLQNNVIIKSRPNTNDYILVDGLHEPIIDSDTFEKAMQIISKRGIPPLSCNTTLKNPLAGIVYCSKCGSLLTRLAKNKKMPYDYLKCPNPYCDNISAPLYLIEKTIITELNSWLFNYKFNWNIDKLNHPYEQQINEKSEMISQIQIQLKKQWNQLERTYSFLEEGLYTTEVYKERKDKISMQIENSQSLINKLEYELHRLIELTTKTEIKLPKAEHIFEVYDILDTAASKNEFLKALLVKVDYLKTQPNKKGNCDNTNFSLDIYPKVVKL
ncbi:MAG: Recombinase [Anaerocolumna sp.]|nr:Recombinase [Anaerocolumna sp.]